MENRAAVFANQPQDVEVYRNGAWWPGSLLGWRHDSDGGCQVWVRVPAGGAEETTWTALDYLRLPEREPAPQPSGRLSSVGALAGADTTLTGTMTAIRAVPVPAPRTAGASSGGAEPTATMNLFTLRGVAGDPAASAGSGSGGRRRAPEPVDAARAGADVRRPVPGPTPGRHRAPAPGPGAAGRHRAADTEVRPAVRADGVSGVTEPSGAPVPAAPEGPLTRPMRLDDLPGRIPGPRRAPRDGWLAGR
jgi:hypothetical protein